MSRPRTLKLRKGPNHEVQPHLTIVGHGKHTFLWVGDKHCYSYSECSQRELHDFAQALIRRVMQPYRKLNKESKKAGNS